MASSLKKLDKKNRKHQHVVTKETGAICLMSPSKTLAICNAGLVNGLSEEVIVEHFSSYGIIDKIMLLPGKSCSFIKYRNVSSAIEAYNKINGVLNIAQYSKPVFLSYVEDLPNVKYKKSHNILPPGLILIENFITEKEEKELLSLDESSSQSTISMKHRNVQHYGYEFKYAINNVDKDKPMAEGIPEKYHFIPSRLRNKCKTCEHFYPDQLTINCYQPGQGIPPHIDTHSAFEDPIVSLSLGSSVVMDFKHDDSTHLCVLLPQRSLLVMSDESRYAWTHGIVPKKFDVVVNDGGYNILHRQTRISLTFRKVRMGKCNCIYKTKCDSQSQTIHSKETNLENTLAVKLEEVHVHKVYEEIAQHFDHTRHRPWPNVVSFIKGFKTGSLIIDVGCGNGKYLANNQNIYNIGCDRSSKLMEICTSKGFEVFICNSLNIPVKDNVADGIISIAVIHHMANKERRIQAIREIVRILKVGGKALIYVWAKDQIRDDKKSGYVKQIRRKQRGLQESDLEQKESFTLINDIKLPIHENRSNFKHKDLLVPWKLKKVPQTNCNDDIFLRYYHVFEDSELENLCKTIDGIVVVKYYYDEGNWCVIIEKIK